MVYSEITQHEKKIVLDVYGNFVNSSCKPTFFNNIKDYSSEFDLSLNKVLESSSLKSCKSLIKFDHLNILTNNLKNASITWKNTVSYAVSILIIHQQSGWVGEKHLDLIFVFNTKAQEIEAINQLFFKSLEKYCNLKKIDFTLFTDHFNETLAINFELTSSNLKSYLNQHKQDVADNMSYDDTLTNFLYQKIDMMIISSMQFWEEVKKVVFNKDKLQIIR